MYIILSNYALLLIYKYDHVIERILNDKIEFDILKYLILFL